MSNTWTAKNIPNLEGRVAVVTGANSGVGLVTSTELARAGAHVIMAGRSLDKVREALKTITKDQPDAQLSARQLDLASLDSIAAFANGLAEEGVVVDILINNAGVMAIPERRTTADGFELTVGTNHLGHFALTGRLLPLLLQSPSPRVVAVSAQVSRGRNIDMDDLQSDERYRPMESYSKSKLGNVLFAVELQRRARQAGSNLTSVAVHPGTSMTGLQQHGSRASQAIANVILERFLGHPVEEAALPSLYAATAETVVPGGFYAPTGRFELRGAPGLVKLPPAAQDLTAASKLWDTSESLTGVHYTWH
jgi:NAD(P)-dependent dehydrogenase (short-subunit alcohol dehydrogenase family)